MLKLILLTAALGSAGPAPSCAVSVSLREMGKTAVTNADTLTILEADQSVTLALTLSNRGNVQDFTMSLMPTNLDAVNGYSSQSFTLGSSESTSKSVTVRGKAIASGCNYGSRSLRVELRPQNDPNGRVCGEAVLHFLCKPSEMTPRVSTVQAEAAKSPDTAWKPQPSPAGRTAPNSVEPAHRDTVWVRER
jgi:hypothetical protein